MLGLKLIHVNKRAQGTRAGKHIPYFIAVFTDIYTATGPN